MPFRVSGQMLRFLSRSGVYENTRFLVGLHEEHLVLYINDLQDLHNISCVIALQSVLYINDLQG